MTFTEEQARWITGTLGIMQFPDRELPTDSEIPGWRKEHQRAVAGVAVGKQHWERAASVFQEKQSLAPPTKKEKLL